MLTHEHVLLGKITVIRLLNACHLISKSRIMLQTTFWQLAVKYGHLYLKNLYLKKTVAYVLWPIQLIHIILILERCS